MSHNNHGLHGDGIKGQSSSQSALTLAALGVVFGDIGTSPLYAFKEAFVGGHGLGVSPENVLAALSALLNERSHLSPEMALRIEKAFGVSMDTLMRMQNSYDIAQTRKRAGEINVTRFSEELRSTGHQPQ